ncbi:MAG TPA: hypothetical protein VGL81_13865 [Polyangiaceae bacterium]
MARRLALLSLLVALAVACKRDGAAASHAASTTPVPAPPTLIAEGVLRDPDVFWKRLRSGGGVSLAHLHESAAGAILGWAGVDPSVAPLVAGGAPFELALGDAPDGVAYAMAMKLSDPDAARAKLVEGETAMFRGEDDSGMIRLVPRQETASTAVLAVSWTGYLVLASSAADLATLGPYASRTLPTKAPPASSFELRVEPAALEVTGRKAPELATKATAAIAVVARGMLPPDVDAALFAECFTPGIRETLAAAGDLAEARVDADADDAQLDAVAALVPKPGDNLARARFAAMHPASAAPLLEAPRDALAALFWSDTAAAREDDAKTVGACVGKALAPMLGPGGGTKLADLLVAWAHGRGDWETASFLAKPGLAGLVLRAPVTDGPGISATVRGFVDLASQPSVAEAIERLLPLRAGAAIEPVDVPRVGKVQMVMFPSHAPPPKDPTAAPAAFPGLAPPGLAWFVDAKEADIGLGTSPADLVGLAKPAAPFRTNAAVARALGALGADASFAAVVVPPGCCAGTAPVSAPLTLGWGKRATDGRVTLAIGEELFGQLVARITAP